MLSSSYFNNNINTVFLPIIEIQVGTKINEAIKAAVKAKVQYILVLHGKSLLGVIPFESLLLEIEDLQKKGLIDYTDSNFVQIEYQSVQNRTFQKDAYKDNRYIIIYDHSSNCSLGIIDNKIDSEILDNQFTKYLKIMMSLFDGCYDGVIVLNTKSEIILINKSAEKIFEVLAEDVMNKPLERILPKYAVTISTLAEQKTEYCFTVNNKYILVRCNIIYEENRIVGGINFYQDVTLQKQKEFELKSIREREEELEDLIQSSYDGIYITDRNGLTLKVNKSHERITGIKAQDVLGKYMKDIVEEGIVSRFITNQVVAKKEPVTVRQTVVNGKNVVITGSPVFDDLGNVKKVITNVRDITELIKLEKNLEATKEVANLYKKELFKEVSSENIVCISKNFQETLALAKKVSSKDSTVLVLGETGVGKEVIAKYIHLNSYRKNNNYVKINCGAIPVNLLESELFGYVKGAFTGASQTGKVGMFELANDGTLFLDEIGELPLNLQSSLLRVLQEGEITRVGDIKSKKVNVRIIAATNRNLEEMIEKGLFRRDLFYRLNVFSIEVPPLRERTDDIPGLAELIINKLNKKYNDKKIITSRFIGLLCSREWVGNVRELENFIEKQFILSEGDVMDRFYGIYTGEGNEIEDIDPQISVHGIIPLNEAVKRIEYILIKKALEQGKTTYKAAELLGTSQPTLFRKYKELFKDTQKE